MSARDAGGGPDRRSTPTLTLRGQRAITPREDPALELRTLRTTIPMRRP